jgi:excisionase family DNA binding protein
MPIAGHPAYYSLTDAAWILGVDRSTIHRAIRTGALPVVRRRTRLVVPAAALQQLLGTTERTPRTSGGAQ